MIEAVGDAEAGEAVEAQLVVDHDLEHFPIRSHQPAPLPTTPRVPLMGGWEGEWAGTAGPRKRKMG